MVGPVAAFLTQDSPSARPLLGLEMGRAGSSFVLHVTQPSPKTRRAGPGYPRGLSLARIASVCHGYYHKLSLKTIVFAPK
jgi:hypothetical protein